MPLHSYVLLNTGARMPVLGLGTWKSKPGEVARAVEVALKAGYRHIDTATAYGNEKEVGDGMHAGLKAAGIKREDIFLTTKLNNDDHANPLEALKYSLKQLQTDYLDLWLMHWPAPMTKGCQGADKSIDWIDTWKKMEEVYKAHPDKVKAIGVSNIYGTFFERLMQAATVTPAVNQVELHPGCPGHDIVKLCREKGIAVTAYSPLGSDASKLHDDPIVKEIAEKHSVSPSTVLISLQANREGVTVIPKSVTESRIIANKTLIDLSEEEVNRLLNEVHPTNSFRVCAPEWTGWGDLGFPKK